MCHVWFNKKENKSYRTPVTNGFLELISAHSSFKRKKALSFNKEKQSFVINGSPQFTDIEPLMADIYSFLKLIA